MRFALSPEQVDFGASIRKLLESGQTPAAVRAWAANDPAAGRTLIAQLADAGMFGLGIEEEYGGLGAEPLDQVVAFIEVGRAAAPGPLVETAAAVPALLRALAAVDAEPARRRLPDIAEGTTLATLARTGDGHRTVALDADLADLVLVVDGHRLYTGRVGAAVKSVDPARRLFVVEPEELIAEARTPDLAFEPGAAAFDFGALANAAQLLGAGRALLDAATGYVKQRKQFGRPIGEFQAIKQKLADVLIALDLAEPLLYRAALTTATPRRARDISAAAVACGDAAYRAARTALQVHGAIGYTAEHDLSLWLTRVTALRTAWGTPDLHRRRIAEALRTPAAVDTGSLT
ncbi:acyl-CoA dehydrogenase family protein [Nocardia brevicatena]|uniref:acyl-CoA dehydrogenase family protein n=1 Tax=Nocardia brevicatena TaxID=37327 RepID=UPI0002ECC4E0|nr:acyl-CoA dehydrogenase family protein [Nocardia brevicatena]